MAKLPEVIQIAAATLAVVAIGQELAKPASERTWRGKVGGFVPYDFTMPSIDRLRETYWNPSDEQILTNRVFGVGWGVNFYRIWRLVAGTFGLDQETSGRASSVQPPLRTD